MHAMDTTTFRNKRWRSSMPCTGEDPVSRFNRELIDALGFPETAKARKVTIVCEEGQIPIITAEFIEYTAPALDKVRDAAGRLAAEFPRTVKAG